MICSPLEIDLAEKMLVFDPPKRITVDRSKITKLRYDLISSLCRSGVDAIVQNTTTTQNQNQYGFEKKKEEASPIFV